MICRRFSSPCVERTLFVVLVGSERHKGICESQYQVNNGRPNRLHPSNWAQDNAPKQSFCRFVEMILCNFHTTSQLPFTDYQRKTGIGNIKLNIFRIINIFFCVFLPCVKHKIGKLVSNACSLSDGTIFRTLFPPGACFLSFDFLDAPKAAFYGKRVAV